MPKMTHKEKIVKLLKDGRWHSMRELNDICYRYGARLMELKKIGYYWEKRRDSGKRNFYWYRFIPEYSLDQYVKEHKPHNPQMELV